MAERTPLELDRERVTCMLLINTQLMKKIINIYTNFLTNQQMLQQLPSQNKQTIIELYQNCTRRLHCNLLVLTYINEKYHSDPSQQQLQQPKPQFPIIILPPQEMPELNQLYNKLQELYPEAVQFLRVKLQQLRKGQLPQQPGVAGVAPEQPNQQSPQMPQNQPPPGQQPSHLQQNIQQQAGVNSRNQLPYLDFNGQPPQSIAPQNMSQQDMRHGSNSSGQGLDTIPQRQFSPQQAGMSTFNNEFADSNFDEMNRPTVTPSQQRAQIQQHQQQGMQSQMMGNISPQLLLQNQGADQNGGVDQMGGMGQINPMQMNQLGNGPMGGQMRVGMGTQMNQINPIGQMNHMGQMNQMNQMNQSGNQGSMTGASGAGMNMNGGGHDSNNDYLNGMMDFFNV